MLKRDFIRNMIFLVLLAAVLVFLRLVIFDIYKVKEQDGNAYVRTDDVLLIKRQETPKYKDFVIYKVDGEKYLGRVIGLPNQNVTYMDDIFYLDTAVEEQVYLDSLKTSFLTESGGEGPFTSDFTIETLTAGQHQTIPADYYLILNDNRQNTADSRTFGLIAKDQIKGIVTFRLLPFNEFGFMEVE